MHAALSRALSTGLCGVSSASFNPSIYWPRVPQMPFLRRLSQCCTLASASCRFPVRITLPAPQCRLLSATPLTTAVPISPRWLSELKARIGRCLSFGLKPAQIDEAGGVLSIIAQDWRELLAGSEGFLVGKGRAGLEGQEVVWGEMVGFQKSPHQSCSLG